MGRRSRKDDAATTLLTHVRELQIRLLITVGVLAAAGTTAYFYYGPILDILRAPLHAPLYYSTPAGSFAFVMKICLVAGIAVSVPLIVYNLVMFVRPAFPAVFTRRRVFSMTFGSVVLAAVGTIFGYVVIIPGALHFFTGFQVDGLHALISADSYLNFVVNVIITFVLVFQLPILASVIDRIKPIPPRAMLKGEKWAFIGSLVIALLVPFAFDLMTQLLIAAPIFILYNISFVVIAFQHSLARRHAKKRERVQARIARKATPAKSAPAPVAIQSHPQLNGLFTQTPRSAAPAHTHPVVAAQHLHATTTPSSVLKRPVSRPRGSMDIVSPSHVSTPSSPAHIRTPQPLRPPVRSENITRSTPMNTMRFISDIR